MASYRFGVEWIARNDNAGEDLPGNADAEENVSTYISTALLADLFDKDTATVARDVMRKRAQLLKEEQK